ncbi:MAG: hypothetical protein WHT07_07200 [Desulfobaccales bacterium]
MVTPDGFLCLPLLFDPEVARDLQHLPPVTDSKAFPFTLSPGGDGQVIPTVRLTSLVACYHLLWPEAYEKAREALLQEVGLPLEKDPVLEGWLARLVLEVLPHFVRLSPAATRDRLGPEAVITALAQRLQIPRAYYEQARKAGAPGDLARRLAALEALAGSAPPPPCGRVSGRELDHWLAQALRARMLERERQILSERLAQSRHHPEESRLARTALLLYLRDRGELELDGFGFFPDARSAGDYWVYKRTGEYFLQDYFGRLYLFPDCRVAVSTRERLRPVVWEKYKHPFLRRHAPRQEICLPKEYQVPLVVGPREIIAALEAGLTALYYGYNPRRRNGYHSLDRHRGEQLVSFDDYRLSSEDPRVLSGRVEVKNRYL